MAFEVVPEEATPPGDPQAPGPKASPKKRAVAITATAIILLTALGAGVYFGLRDPDAAPKTEDVLGEPTQAAGTSNPPPTVPSRPAEPSQSQAPASSSPAFNPLPNVPINPSPAHLYLQIPLGTTLRWQGGDPLGELVRYTVLLEGVEKCVSTSLEECPVAGLAAGHAYKWRVRAADAAGQTSLSAEWQFTTNFYPNVPQIVSPSDLSENRPLSLSLKWTGSDPDGNLGLTHRVLFKPSADPTTTDVQCDWGDATECAVANLQALTWYHWQVETKDAQGLTKLGPVWKFKTTEGTDPDGGCEIICPQG